MAISKIKVGNDTHDISVAAENVTGTLSTSHGGTGGSTKLEAANSLDFWSLTEGTNIEANTDLNNLTTPGNYRCANGDNAKTLVNAPTNVTDVGYLFTMKVGCLPGYSNYLYQEIVTFGYNIHYYRRKPGADEAWQPWSKSFNTHTVIPLENGGTGSSTSIAGAPKNAIIKKVNEDNGVSLTYTATKKGALYALEADGVPAFGTLPMECGGTGSGITLPGAPDGAFVRKRTDSEGSKYLGYSEYVSLSNDVSGYLGLANGGTGNTLANAPNNAIIRKGSNVDYLWYTSTNNGAFYATSENGMPTFGTLPIAQGGTNATSASGARTNLGFSYRTSAPTSAPSTGEGAVCFVVDSGAALPVAEGGTGASTKVNAVKNLGMYPVGSVYVTSTNSNPSSYLGGTWECFDKELRGKVFDSTSTSGFWTYNSTNTESDSQVYAYREGHIIHMRFDIHTKVDMGESTYNLGTLDYEYMGFGSFPYSAIYAAATSDGGNAVGYCRLDYSSGVLQMVDVNPKTDGNLLAAGSWLYLILEMPITSNAMYDEAVDRFHWKRTA